MGDFEMRADPLTQAWRLEHVVRGDKSLMAAAAILRQASDMPPNGRREREHDEARAWIALATAHYAAANVRARPDESRTLRSGVQALTINQPQPGPAVIVVTDPRTGPMRS